MELSITQVPLWLSLSFIVSFVTVPVFLIAQAAKAACSQGSIKDGDKIAKRIILFYWVFLAIVGLVSLSGYYMENVLPPRIMVFTIIPLFLFYMIYVSRSTWFKLIFEHIRLEQLIFIHIFRFVGVFFFLIYIYDAIPLEFALAGGIGDLVAATLVFPVIAALRMKRSYAKLLVWIWNIIGLLDIISVLATALILTHKAIPINEVGVQQITTFPFSWIPAFAPATIVFLHILVLRKLKEL